MPILALLTHDTGVEEAIRAPLGGRYVLARARSWDRLVGMVRERPITSVALDEAAIPVRAGPLGAVSELRERFPSVSAILIARPDSDPHGLLRLGRAGMQGLVLLGLDELAHAIPRVVREADGLGTEALVTRAVSPYLPVRITLAVRLALEGVAQGWDADGLAARLGMTRPHLSVCLKATGLPSVGRLLVWARLLHAGRWLCDPARSAESVSRQLEYSSGAAFRRALKAYTGATPGEVVGAGGFSFVLESFLARCGLTARTAGRSVA